MITPIIRHPAAFVQHQLQSTSTMGPSPAIPAGYTFSNSSYDYLLFHLLLLLQVTLFKPLQVLICYFLQGLFPKRGSQTSQVGCYSTSVWFLSFHRMWAMCLRCIFGTGGCKITQQNRTNCKLCRYQVWYTIRQGNVTKKCCSAKYGFLKCSFDRIYWNSIPPSQILAPKIKWS